MGDEWWGLIGVTLLILIVMAVAAVFSELKERKLIKSGVLPTLENTTDADIAQLAKSEYKVWAIKRYRQLYNVSLKEAEQKVEALQK